MIYGIDISNHQAGLSLDKVFPDFVILKATEGTNFVDIYCDSWVQQAKSLRIPWGFYHFAMEANPETEARFFLDNTRDYFGQGIPVLDWETDQTVDWVNIFVKTVHDETGVWPWIYANPWRFNQGGVEQNCARWVAAYPGGTPNFNEPPYANGNVVAWQFTSTGRLEGWDGNLDLNVFYGDENDWQAYVEGDNAMTVDDILNAEIPVQKPDGTQGTMPLWQAISWAYTQSYESVRILQEMEKGE